MKLSEQLKLLAQGIYPDTGEFLNDSSITNSPEAIRMLYKLSEEIAYYEKPKKTKKGNLREKNIARNRPPRSHFPWNDEHRKLLVEDFKSNPDMQGLATKYERSVLAIAVQLKKLDLISEEELESYRY